MNYVVTTTWSHPAEMNKAKMAEFQQTFSGLKQDVMDEAEGLKQTVNVDALEQDIGAATKIDVDVNLSEMDLDIAGDIKKDV